MHSGHGESDTAIQTQLLTSGETILKSRHRRTREQSPCFVYRIKGAAGLLSNGQGWVREGTNILNTILALISLQPYQVVLIVTPIYRWQTGVKGG